MEGAGMLLSGETEKGRDGEAGKKERENKKEKGGKRKEKRFQRK